MDECALLQGDNTDILPTLALKSVQCVVTSPPYYGLRDYGLVPTIYPDVAYSPMSGLPAMTIPAQSVCLGLETTPEAYVGHLVHVFRLAREALADDGVVFLNLGDSYNSNAHWSGGSANAQCGNTKRISGTKTRPLTSGLKPKNLMGIPWRVAFALQADGWILRNDVIWHKPAAMPESIKDRFTKDHEYVFFFSKSERYFFDQKAVAEPAQPRTITSSTFKRVNSKRGIPLVPNNPSPTHREDRADTLPAQTRNRRTVWRINPKGTSDAHYAPFPEALVEPCILAGSRVGNTILDPFGGTGTTARVAVKHNRRAVSIDLNPAYITIQERKTNGIQRTLMNGGVL